MTTNFPNGISSHGVPILPTSQLFVGTAYFVDSRYGSDGNNGKSTGKPFATLNKAVGVCSANRGDVIYLMPLHYEDIGDTSTTGTIDLDVAGISVIGLGIGSNMPRFDFNDADSDFVIGADDILVQNVNFEATVTIVKIGIQLEAGVTGTIIRNCKFSVETTTTDEFLISINLLAGCNNTIIEGCYMDMGLGGAAHGIKLVGASSDVRVSRNTIKGDYSVANIGGITTLSLEVDINDNLLMNGGTGNVGAVANIVLLTGTTGIVRNNFCVCNLSTKLGSIAADTVMLFENYYNEDITGTGGIIGTASADG